MDSAQLNYAPAPVSSRCLALWSSELGSNLKLKEVLAPDACTSIVTNALCTGERPYKPDLQACNTTWNEQAALYCEPERFNSLTLGELQAARVWVEDTEQAKGLAKLWYISDNIAAAPPGFLLYINNKKNLTDSASFIHNPLYAHKYAEYARAASVDFVVYYTNYYGMKVDPKSTYF